MDKGNLPNLLLGVFDRDSLSFPGFELYGSLDLQQCTTAATQHRCGRSTCSAGSTFRIVFVSTLCTYSVEGFDMAGAECLMSGADQCG